MTRRKWIRYGYLDGRPVRFTRLCTEAWWIPQHGGKWRPADLPDVCQNASVLTPRNFQKVFPHLPRLPKQAFKG